MSNLRPPLPGRIFDCGGPPVVSWLIPLLFLVVIAALVVWVVLRVTGRRYPGSPPAAAWPPAARPGPGDAALELVRSRYARGEISREEFVQVSLDLGGPPPLPPHEPTPPSSAGAGQ
jgi:putative membrane protein